MFSNFFIKRPIFAVVIAILMVLAGLITLNTLPVAQYPDITPPTVMVSCSYPGASAATVAQAIGVPVEQQVNGVEGMIYMSSTSSDDGSYMLTVTFENGTDIDRAAVDIQNLVSQVQSQLPEAVVQQGVSVRKESSNHVLFVTLESNKSELYDALYLTNYAQLNLVDPLSRVKGVGNVGAFGGGEYSMRIWLDPAQMRARGLTPADVHAAIAAQNAEVSAGSVGATPTGGKDEFNYTLNVTGRLSDVSQFENIVLRTDGNGILRLKDVAHVELGSNSYSSSVKINGHPTSMLGIAQLPGANALDVADGSLKELERLSHYFPDGISYHVVQNSSDYVHQSIEELLVTFLETSLIVLAVILIFLQNWRATVIPMITIPVSLIATFAVMKLLGFTINTLTLFGLVLAIAIVVDDAIVVVEDCMRLLTQGKISRRDAAEKAIKELTGPVVGEVLVLLSVFIPTAFVSGITGQLYKQFALTIAISTAFSGFNALTLTPALCALFLQPRKESNFFLYRWFNRGWGWLEKRYNALVAIMLRHDKVSMLIYLAITVLAFWGFMTRPTSYLPPEDMGYFMTSVQLPPGASLQRTEKVMDEIAGKVRKEVPQVKDVISMAGNSFFGGNGSNAGSLLVTLKPWSERKGAKNGIDAVIEHVNRITAGVPECYAFSINPPAIPGLGMSSGLEMQILDISNLGTAQLAKAVNSVRQAASQSDDIESVTSTFQGETPQFRLTFDRDRAELMGVNLSDIYSTLSAYMGQSYVNDFDEFGRSFQVIMKAQGSNRDNVDDVLRLGVRNSSGEMVPFSAFTSVEPVMGLSSVSRYNMYTTAGVTANTRHGVSSSEGIADMEKIVDDTLGKNYSYAWTGEAYQETESGVTINLVFIFAIIMTLLVLAAQYESWSDPIAVILAMPTAVLGTVVGCLCMGQSVSIYTQIGLILLLGMSAKNAILIVEFAMDYRKQGATILEAAQEAGQVRFRPIMMTALAFVFGVLPMLFADGPGANSRKALGTAVVFGMAMNAFIGTLFVPNFWMLMQTLNEKIRARFTSRPSSGSQPPSDSQSSPDSGS